MPSQQNRPNKKKKKITGNVQPEKVHKTLLKWVLFILVGVIVYTLYLLLIPKDIDLFKTTVAAKQGSLEVYLTEVCAIIRDERVVITPVSGEVDYLVDDLSKIGANTSVVRVTNSEVLNEVNPNVDKFKKEINEFIRQCEVEKTSFNDELVSIKDDISAKKAQKRTFSKNNDLDGVTRMDQEIELLTAKQTDLLNEIKLLESEIVSSTDMLQKIIETVQDSVGRGILDIKSFSSSIISRSLDGLENVLRPRNPHLLDVNYEELEITEYEIKDKEFVTAGQAVFKEIQNYKTQVLVRVDFDKYTPPTKGSKIGMRFPKHATEIVQCTIEDIKCVDEENNIWAIFATLDRFSTSLTSVRFTDVDIVLTTTRGIVIPKNTIVEENGQQGVYALRKNKFVFTPLEIL